MDILLILIVVGIIAYFLFNPKKSKKSGTTSFTIERTFEENLDLIKEGDKLSLWAKPNSNHVYMYAPGSVGGQGAIAVAKSKDLHFLVQHSEKKITATVRKLDLENGVVNIHVDL